MATNAWIQFNSALIREGCFKEQRLPESPNTKETLTFGKWLYKEWHDVPEIPYPTSSPTPSPTPSPSSPKKDA